MTVQPGEHVIYFDGYQEAQGVVARIERHGERRWVALVDLDTLRPTQGRSRLWREEKEGMTLV